MVIKMVLEVVAIDGLQRLSNALRLERIPQTHHLRKPLPEELIRKASLAVLVTNLAIL